MSLSGIVYCKCLCMLCLVCVGFCTHLLIVLFSGGFLLLNCAVGNTVFALLRLTSLPPVRTPYRIPDQLNGVSRSKYPGYRGGGARPGARSNAPPSWDRHGPHCPDNGPLGETGSSTSAFTSTTGVSTTRPSFSWSQWDSSLPSPGIRWDGCKLPGVPLAAGLIPGNRPPGSFGP